MPVHFLSYPKCTKCRLHEAAKSVGIPTKRLPDSLWPDPSAPALVVVGQNPGDEEDAAGVSWIGPMGRMLNSVYLAGISACEIASVYLANGARCGPDSVSTTGPFNACIDYLIDDLRHIGYEHRFAPMAVVFCSAPAVRAFYKYAAGESVSQKESFSRQGWVWDILCTCYEKIKGRPPEATVRSIAIFSTYHPGYVWPGRGHEEDIVSVEAHLESARRYLIGDPVKRAEPTIVAPRSPGQSGSGQFYPGDGMNP